jgi:hypothetical protein
MTARRRTTKGPKLRHLEWREVKPGDTALLNGEYRTISDISPHRLDGFAYVRSEDGELAVRNIFERAAILDG